MSRAPTDLRRRVLDASLALIAEDGIAALSMREVSRRAGVTHGAPYHYFADRSSILAALAEEGFELLGQRLRSASAQGTPRARFEACGIAYVFFALENRAMFQIMFRPELWDPSKHPGLDHAAASAFAVLVEIVAAGPWAGHPRMLELVISSWSSAHGLANLWLDGPLGRGLLQGMPIEAEQIAAQVASQIGRLFDAPPA